MILKYELLIPEVIPLLKGFGMYGNFVFLVQDFLILMAGAFFDGTKL